MLKNKNVKIIIGAVIALCVLVAASIWASMSLKSNSVDDFNYQMLAEASEGVSSRTQIDHIIENSLAADADERDDYDTSKYYVYIIVPTDADKSAAVNDFFVNGNFKDYVVNDYRTISEVMPDEKVELVVKSIAEINAMSDMATELGKADMIYISATSNDSYKGNTAISEDLYEFLHNYAFGSNKPLIMDYELDNTGGDIDQPINPGTNSKMFLMTTQDFKNSWKRTKTTNISSWNKDSDLESTIQAYIESPRSTYTTYQVNNLTKPKGYESWVDYWKRTGTTEPTLNVLYIHGDNHDANDELTMNKLAKWMISDDGRPSVFGVNSSEYDLPKEVAVSFSPANLVNDDLLYYVNTNGVKVNKFDYIFIAPGAYDNCDILDPARERLNELSEGTVDELSENTKRLTYIMFGNIEGASSGSTGGTTAGSEDLSIDTSTNYGKLIDLSITTNGYAKKSNVLVVGTDYMQTMASAPESNPSKIGAIVALINKSTYRTYAGSGAGGISGSVSTDTFRVLELQPCYPIDLDLAYNNPISTRNSYYATETRFGRKGNYYTIPGNVVNGLSEDELSPNTEYYQWDLSVAKIAYALNIPADQIELVQMSTAEFISSKADVTNAYDVIYIGGNMSAMKPTRWYGYVSNTSAPSHNTGYASYAMYSHTGEIIDIVSQKTGPQGDKVVAGSLDNYFTQLNGNDLTTDRYNQLIDYVDSGMPIIIGSELWNRYTEAENMNNPLQNKYLDVDSNMYALLEYLDEKEKTDTEASTLDDNNILVGWNNKLSRVDANPLLVNPDNNEKLNYLSDYYVSLDKSEVIQTTDGAGNVTYQTEKVSNSLKLYGASEEVTVMNEALSDELLELVMEDSNIRPKFSFDTNAIPYVSGDENSLIRKATLTNGQLYWNITVSNFNSNQNYEYMAYLLEDLNDNAEFDLKTEVVNKQKVVDGKASVYYSVPSEFWGAISWKVVVVATKKDSTTANGATANGTANISSIARDDDDPKKKATILEIMPMSFADNGHYYSEHHDYAAQDGHSLYLDVNYQQGTGNDFVYSSLDDTGYYNSNKVITDQITYNYSGSIGSGGYAFTSNGGSGAFWKNTNVYSSQYAYNSSNRIYLGKYQPRLSINRFDVVKDNEDWTYNYIDEIADDYDLTLDIMYLDDIEYYAYMANTLSEEKRSDYAAKAVTNYNIYMSYLQPNYTGKYTNEDDDPYYIYQEKETALRNLILDAMNGNISGYVPTADDKVVLQAILDSKDYFKIFYVGKLADFPIYSPNSENGKLIYNTYSAYVEENDKKIDAYRAWRHYNLLSYGPDEYLRQNYDVICFGFYDDLKYGYDYSDNACAAFESFVNPSEESELNPGSLLITHDNMKKFDDAGYSHNFTSAMREMIGMDRFHFTTDDATADSFVQKNTAVINGVQDKKYFVTTLAYDYNFGRSSDYSGAEWAQKSGEFVKDLNNGKSFIDKLIRNSNAGQGRYIVGYPGLSNTHAIVRTNSSVSFPYTYEEYEVTTQMSWNMNQAEALKLTGTTKATQINRGIVTTYPFYIPSDLRISPTHSQTYALDLEDDTVTAWYTLAADNLISSNGSVSAANPSDNPDYGTLKNNSSTYAAAPKDAMNNYYIYSKGNVTYCGAGHAAITGESRDNNDERRLFINVLVNLANKSTKVVYEEKPEVVLYDPDGVTPAGPSGSEIVKYNTENGYYINVTSGVSYPEFGFKIDKSASQTIEDVVIFYDLDYDPTADATFNNMPIIAGEGAKNHIIVTPTEDMLDILGNDEVYLMNRENCPSLITDRSYFDAYGGKYTYLVIRATVKDANGTTYVVTERIKIMLTRELLNLT